MYSFELLMMGWRTAWNIRAFCRNKRIV
jgi:hypothetical protein